MPALSERDLKDKAHAFVARGLLEPALEAYKALICLNGRDALYRLKHAELSARLGRVEAAVASYRIAAHLLSASGRVAQAKAALHAGMKLAPRDLTLRRAVAGLIEHAAPKLSLAASADAITEPCLLPMLE